MNGLDRNTITLWLAAAILAAGGGTIGGKLLEGPQGSGASAHAELVAAQRDQLQKIQALQTEIRLLTYRQGQCDDLFTRHENEHRGLGELSARMDRMEWELKSIKDSVQSSFGRQPSEFLALPETVVSQALKPEN